MRNYYAIDYSNVVFVIIVSKIQEDDHWYWDTCSIHKQRSLLEKLHISVQRCIIFQCGTLVLLVSSDRPKNIAGNDKSMLIRKKYIFFTYVYSLHTYLHAFLFILH